MAHETGLNQLHLTGWVLEAQPLRHTPAGIAMLDMLVAHRSQVEQAGQLRTIDMTLRTIASGDIALLMADVAMGEQLELQGFLAASRKGSSSLVFHVRHFRRLAGEPVATTV